MLESEVNFTSLFLCIKNTENPVLTPMRSMGQTSENPSVYEDFDNFCPIITHSSILRTIPVAFIYKNSLLCKFVLLLSVKQVDLYLQHILKRCITIKLLER